MQLRNNEIGLIKIDKSWKSVTVALVTLWTNKVS